MTESFERDLGRLEGKVDAIQSDNAEIKEALSRMEARLRNQELKNSAISSVCGAVAAAAFAMFKGGGSGA